MPHIRCRGLELESLEKISAPLADGLSEIIGCDRSWLTLELIESKFIIDDNGLERYPFVEVLWFDRGPEVKAKAAKLITDLLKEEGDYSTITVLFDNLKGDDYFENGEHF